MIKYLLFFILIISCNEIKVDNKLSHEKEDIFNENIYDALPFDSLRKEVDQFKVVSFVGKPLGEMLLAFNNESYFVIQLWYSDDKPKKIIGLVFVSPSNFEFNVLFENDNLQNEVLTDQDLIKIDAYFLRNQKIENYDIRYLGVHSIKSLTYEDIETNNWVILRKFI